MGQIKYARHRERSLFKCSTNVSADHEKQECKQYTYEPFQKETASQVLIQDGINYSLKKSDYRVDKCREESGAETFHLEVLTYRMESEVEVRSYDSSW